MIHLNINTLISMKSTISLSTFVQQLKDHPQILNFRTQNDNKPLNQRKIKLGEDEHECRFDLLIDDEYINVLFYIQYDTSSNTILDIDCFTGLHELIDLKKYHKLLKSMIQEVISQSITYQSNDNAIFEMRMNINGGLNNMYPRP